MATKSFTSEFKFNVKSGAKLANAINNSRKVEHTITQPVSDVVRKDEIKKMVKDFLGSN